MTPRIEIANDPDKNADVVDDDDDFEEVHQLLSFRISPSINTDLNVLTKLDLPGCQLSELPMSLPDALPNLSILFLSNNKFTEVPAVIGECKKLQVLQRSLFASLFVVMCFL